MLPGVRKRSYLGVPSTGEQWLPISFMNPDQRSVIVAFDEAS
jgi:hypothetical protein